MDNQVLEALESYKRAKRLVGIERQRVIAMLPEHIASELHYNGPHRAKDLYPAYGAVFDALMKDK